MLNKFLSICDKFTFHQELWLSKHIVLFCGTITYRDCKIGLTLGMQNTIYLGFFYFGFDFM